MTPIETLEATMGPVATKEMHELLEADAEKSRRRQGVQHSKLLGQSFDGLLVASTSIQLRNAALIQMARLHAFIERGIPIVEDRIPQPIVSPTFDPQETVRERLGRFIGYGWPGVLAPHMEVLLREYHRHGYLDLNDTGIPNPAGFNPATYLEVAMMGSNAPCVTALLELGAERARVPVKEFAMGRGDERISVAKGDFDAFVDLIFGSQPHPVRIAIDEGVRRRLAIDMSAVIEQRVSPTREHPAATGATPRRSRL